MCCGPFSRQVFVRESTERVLEERRVAYVALLAVIIQKRVRGWLAVERYRRTRAAILRIQVSSFPFLSLVHLPVFVSIFLCLLLY